MEIHIENISCKKIIGNKIILKLLETKDKNMFLWKQFMSQKNKIKNRIDKEQLFSIQKYEAKINLDKINPDLMYEKWAGVEVLDFDKIPEGMNGMTIEGGIYAVYIHRGKASTFLITLSKALNILPSLGYEFDIFRYQFEMLKEGYNPNDPESSEEVWLPVKKI